MDRHIGADSSNPASRNPATVSVALYTASRVLARLAERRARRLLVRMARQEIEALPEKILKDIGLRRGSIGEFTLELTDRLRPRP